MRDSNCASASAACPLPRAARGISTPSCRSSSRRWSATQSARFMSSLRSARASIRAPTMHRSLRMRVELTELYWLEDQRDLTLSELAELSGFSQQELRDLQACGAIAPV